MTRLFLIHEVLLSAFFLWWLTTVNFVSLGFFAITAAIIMGGVCILTIFSAILYVGFLLFDKFSKDEL